ncbi:MAG: PHP domain-containing protein [Clostridia bacterium]|nr:PHP domain-containing protein [Clostridia bacterium]
MQEKMCDLHTHSTFSDGTKTPEEIVDEAVRIGLSAVALTDHNTVKGLKGFKDAAHGKSIECVNGVEISTDYMDKDIHIVGLFLKEDCFSQIDAFLEAANERKTESTKKLVHALSKDGYKIDYDEIRQSHAGQINRAVVAAELLKKGYITDIKSAFKTLLHENGGYYAPPKRIDSMEAIVFLNSIHAVSVLAHPYLTFHEAEAEGFLRLAVPNGLMAMETRYSTYSEAVSELASRTAKRFGLLESGGSDDHGGNKPHIHLGVGMGKLFVPYSIYEGLLAQS